MLVPRGRKGSGTSLTPADGQLHATVTRLQLLVKPPGSGNRRLSRSSRGRWLRPLPGAGAKTKRGTP